jgi:uncharacterized damage-inducible protein DinB
MTIAEVLLLDYDAEIENTRRVLERIPEDNPQWKPHEKSMPMGRLAVHVARLPMFGSTILTTDELQLATAKFPDLIFQGREQLLADLEETSTVTRQALESSSDEQLLAHWKLSWGDKVIRHDRRAVLYRTMFLNHLVHHRGQLSVYLRLNDVPVPGLYGPSADEQFQSS